MINSFVIAESGGTKTDWLLILDGKVAERRTTSGLHPSVIDSEKHVDFAKDWDQYPDWPQYPLFFFGAGCFRDEGKKIVSDLLASVFEKRTVFSDLHAAAISLFGDNSGWFAILGTGSVLGFWNGREVAEVIGGLGYKLGDEGSGFYFGKLVLEAAKNGTLNTAQEIKFQEEFKNQIPNFNDITSFDRSEVASLAKNLSGSHEFNFYHKTNIRSFFEMYVKAQNSLKQLGVVGSYGYSQRTILREVANEFGVEIIEIIERPIGRLIEQKGCFVE